MSSEIDSFDCDTAVQALAFAFEELSLRQQRDADYEREVESLERKKLRLETRLRAVNLKVEQLKRDAARQNSAIVRELEREAESLTQDVSKAKEEAQALEDQFAQVEAKCEVMEKENAELRRTAADLERTVEELKSQDSTGVAEAFKTRKLLQELRFEVAQLDQAQRELCVAERHSKNRVDSLLNERRQRAESTRRLETENDALRLALIEARSRSSCGMPDRRRPCGVVNDDIGATKEGDVGSGFHVTGADDNNVERELWEQRRQQMWDEIVRMREEYAVLLKSVGYREAKSVAVQTGIESCRGSAEIYHEQLEP